MNDDTILLAAWRDLCAEGSFAATHLAFLVVCAQPGVIVRRVHPSFLMPPEQPDE